MTADVDRCERCGAKVVEYRHALSIPLLRGLAKLHAAGGGPINLKEIGLTHSQWDNFQKLRYWGLVRQTFVAGKRVGGTWEITTRGRAFLAGGVPVPRVVWTYRGERVRYEDAMICAAEVDGGYQLREVWAAEAVPHEVST